MNLRQYSQEFSNNGVTPLGGKWATTAIAQMLTTMTATAKSANQIVAAVNGDVSQGYELYRWSWQRWGCPVSTLLQGPPPQVPKVTVKKAAIKFGCRSPFRASRDIHSAE